MERKKPSSKSQKKAHSSKKNSEGTSRIDSSEGKSYERIHSSEETSSDELVIADESQIQPAGCYSCATEEESRQKEAPIKLKIRSSTSKSLEKEHSSKVSSCEKRFSDEMVNAGSSQKQLYHSRASTEGNSHKMLFSRKERKKPSSSKPPIKLFIKKDAQETLHGTQGSRRPRQEMNYCEYSSPEESKNNAKPGKFKKEKGYNKPGPTISVGLDESRTQRAKLYSCTNDGESSQKEATRKLDILKIRISTSKSLAKEHSSKIKETSRSKGKASCKESFSVEMVNAGSSQKQHYYSRAITEGNSHKMVFRRKERKNSPSSKPLIKRFTKKDVEEKLHRTKGHRRTREEINYYEGSSPEVESRNNAMFPIGSDFFQESSCSSETSRSKGKRCKRIHSNEETSSDKLINVDGSPIQQAVLYSCATDGESSQKEATRKMDSLKIGPSTSKSLAKENSLKINVEEASRSKRKAYNRIASGEESFSNEIENAGSSQKQRYHLRASTEGNGHKMVFKRKERKKPSSSKPPIKHFTKKDEETLHRTQSSRITSKKPNYCEDSFPEELRNNAMIPIHSSFSEHGGDTTHSSRSLLPSKYKAGKGHDEQTIDSGPTDSRGLCHIDKKIDSKNNIIDDVKFFEQSAGPSKTSRSKGKPYQGIHSSEETSSDELIIVDGSPIQQAESSQKEATRKLDMEKTRPSTSKSLAKEHSSKVNVEETLHRSQGSQITSKKLNYYKDSSPEKLRNNAVLSISSSFSATGGATTHSSLSLPSSRVRIGKGYDKQKINPEVTISYGFCPYMDRKIDRNNNIKPSGNFFQESSGPETVPNIQGLPKPDPLYHLRKHLNDTMKNSKTGDGAGARKASEKTNKTFAEFKSLKKKRDEEEKARTSKIADAKPQLSRSFHYKRNDSFKSNIPMIDSDVGMKHKDDGTKDKDNVFAKNSPKVLNNGIVNKEGEKSKSLSKLGKTKDLASKTKADNVEDAAKVPPYGVLHENITDPKISPINTGNKRGLERRSDPGSLLKENRSPPSI